MQEILMMFYLFGCWHRWGKWQTVAQGDAYSGEYDKLTGNPQTPTRIGFWEKQRRVCLLCEKSQLRVTRT